MLAYLLLVLGLCLLFVGGHLLVSSVISLSKLLHIKPLFLSIVILGFMTSSPEWFVTFLAACEGMPQWISSIVSVCKGSPELALANVLGSNIVNIFLILSLTGLLCSIQKTDKQVLKFDLPCLLFFTVLLGLLAYDGVLNFKDGLICLAVFVSYLILSFQKRKQEDNSVLENLPAPSLSLTMSLLYLLFGFLSLFFGSNFAIDSSIEVARSLSLSQKFVGIFMLSVGTSLPELATCLVAAFRKEVDMLVGSIVGSNIFNTLFIVGSASLLQPLKVSSGFYPDYLFSLFVIFVLWLVLFKFKRLPVWFCLSAVFVYAVYIYNLA